MRPAWWTIAKLELTLAVRDRGSVIWSLIAPVAMAWIFGSMFGDGGPPAPTRVTVDGGDNPPAVTAFVADNLRAHGMVADTTGVRVVLPDSILARMRDGRKVTAQVYKGSASDIRVQSVSARVRDALFRLSFQHEAVTADIAAGREPALSTADAPIALEVRTLGSAPRVPSGAEHTLPAMLVMFIMFQLTTFFLGVWVEDLKTGKTRRITMSPTRTRDILIAQIVARLLWSVLQVAIILGLGGVLLGVHLNAPVFPLLALLGAYMIAAASLGMLLASFFRTTEKANAIGVIVSLVMAALGGCWWPLEIVPAAMRHLALVFPTGQAMDALGELTTLGASAPFPLSNIVVLLLMTAVMMPIAARRMRAQMMVG